MTLEKIPGDSMTVGWIDPAEAFQPLLLENVVVGIGNLPTLPSVAAYLLNHADEEVHLPRVIQMLSYDQVMTARILRYANSAFVSSPKAIRTVEEAINRIGLNAVREMVCISAVSGLMVPDRCPEFALKLFWRHAVGTACCAASLARRVGAGASHAFTAGLLHDIGRMVLACTFPVDYTRALRYQAETLCTVLAAEHATVGIDHVETGLELARCWKLDEGLQAAIAAHHEEESTALTAMGGRAALPAIVRLSNLMAHAVDLADPDDAGGFDILGAELAALGLKENDYPAVLAQARTAYRQAVEALSL